MVEGAGNYEVLSGNGFIEEESICSHRKEKWRILQKLRRRECIAASTDARETGNTPTAVVPCVPREPRGEIMEVYHSDKWSAHLGQRLE